MTDEGTILINLESRIAWDLVIPTEPLEIHVGDDTTLTLHRLTDDDPGFRAFPPIIVCLASFRLQPEPTCRSVFSGLAAYNLAWDESKSLKDRVQTEGGGAMCAQWGQEPEWSSQWFRSYCSDVHAELLVRVRHALKLIRWRFNLDGGHRPIVSTRPATWSEDGIHWHTLPTLLSVERVPTQRVVIDDAFSQEIDELVNAPAMNEPLGHELFREAWVQRHNSGRTALMVGIAAAEAGVKEFISTLEPGAEWLVRNAPSPPFATFSKTMSLH